jgi:L-asparaginase
MRRLLLIYTGGTIGMITNAQTGALESFDFAHLYAHIPELKRFELDIQVKSFAKPLDSSEVSPQHWQQIAAWITEDYDEFDGFVILHGTDTMAYTASALSFMLQGLKKPIVFTGSQLPIGIIRTDGKENLITAIEIAAASDAQGAPILQEVAVYFEYALFRGNRSSKVSAHQFEAFAAPNYPLLAKAGVQIEWYKERLFRTNLPALQPQLQLHNEVLIWRLFPGMPISIYASALKYPAVKILILETFGAGNAFSTAEFQSVIQGFIAAGGLVLNITQCQSGAVRQGAYQTSTFFEQIGVISGTDLTAEAALTKCMFALANVDAANRGHFLKTAIVGELTTPDNG